MLGGRTGAEREEIKIQGMQGSGFLGFFPLFRGARSQGFSTGLSGPLATPAKLLAGQSCCPGLLCWAPLTKGLRGAQRTGMPTGQQGGTEPSQLVVSHSPKPVS